MRMSYRLSQLAATVALIVLAFVLAPSVAIAHAGHAHAAAPVADEALHTKGEAQPPGARGTNLVAPTPDRAAALCSTSCCYAGMNCCSALGAVLAEIGPPQARRTHRGALNAYQAGMEPAVPLKPPQATARARSAHF